jgi:hypothetical protein
MILHIPHASKEIPAGLRDQIILSDEELASELTEMTDAFTGKLFTCRGATRIVFPVSRDLYMDERSDCMNEHFFRIHLAVEELLGDLLRVAAGGPERGGP